MVNLTLLRDSDATPSADPGPGFRSSTLGVVTLRSSTTVCLSLGQWQPGPLSYGAIVQDDVNSS